MSRSALGSAEAWIGGGGAGRGHESPCERDGTAPGPCDPAGAIVDCRQSPHMETTMEVVGSGAFWDARTAPVNERSASSTSAIALADGHGPRDLPAGHGPRGSRRARRGVRIDRRRRRSGSCVSSASANASGTAGRARRGLVRRRSWQPGSSCVRAVDGSLGPKPAVGPPGHPGPARDAQLPASARPMAAGRGRTGGGSTWARTRGVGHRAGPAARRRDARPAVRELEGVRGPVARAFRRPGCDCRTTTERPGPTTSWSPGTRTTPSITGTSVSRPIPTTVASSTCSGRTCRRTAATSTSTSPGARPTAGRGPTRRRRACRASTASRSRLVATGCSRLLASQRSARHPRDPERGLRPDLGPERELVVWASEAGTEPGAGRRAGAGGVLERHGRLAVRPSAWGAAAERRGARRLLRRIGGDAAAADGHGCGCDRSSCAMRGWSTRGAHGAGRATSLVRAGRIAAIGEGSRTGAPAAASVAGPRWPLGRAGPDERPCPRLSRRRPGPGDRLHGENRSQTRRPLSIARLEATLRAGVTTIRDVGGPAT